MAKTPENQFRFNIEGDRFTVQEPITIESFTDGKLPLLKILSQQKLWLERPSGSFLVTDLKIGAVMPDLKGVVTFKYPGALPNINAR